MTVKIGIIGGSGLDNPDMFTNARDTFTSTVWGEPSSPLREGEIAGVPVALLARHGRSHTLAPSSVNYRANVQALKDAGFTVKMKASTRAMNDVERRRVMETLISEIQIHEDRQPNGQWLKSIRFRLPIIEEDMNLSLDNNEHVETVVALHWTDM